ncbi:hypothetical protein WEI85_17110 [Actinomycetes bacterium KLBMP 9797]
MSTIEGKRRRRPPALLIVPGVALALAGVLWFVVGLVAVITSDPLDPPHWLVFLGAPVGLFGAFGGGALALVGQHIAVERRWQDGRRRGIVTLSDLRPGRAGDSRQELTCRLDIQIAGEDPRRGDHRTSVGPLDAVRMVDGATFPCQVSPTVPNRIRVWLYTDPDAAELTGRYLDFRPA